MCVVLDFEKKISHEVKGWVQIGLPKEKQPYNIQTK